MVVVKENCYRRFQWPYKGSQAETPEKGRNICFLDRMQLFQDLVIPHPLWKRIPPSFMFCPFIYLEVFLSPSPVLSKSQVSENGHADFIKSDSQCLKNKVKLKGKWFIVEKKMSFVA